MSTRQTMQLTPAEQATWLRDGHTMILTTIGKDGYPHSVAMWYVLLDGCICFSTYAKAQKTVNAARSPKVACVLEDGRTYDSLRGLMIRGDAVVDPDAELNGQVQFDLFKKYVAEPGAEVPPEMEATIRQRGRKRVVIKVTPVKTVSWDHGKQR